MLGWAGIWIDVVLASQGLGVQGWHINVSRHIKEINGCVLRTSKHRDVFTVCPSVAEGGKLYIPSAEQECFKFPAPLLLSHSANTISHCH